MPKVVVSSPGMLVVVKPPGWEVDSVENESDAACMSTFLQRLFDRHKFPLLHAKKFGFGFVHRLDVASSGLVLVGTTFEGLFSLQWQKNIYVIAREYQVVSYDLQAAAMHTVDAGVNVSGTKASRTLTEDGGQPALSYFLTQVHCKGGGADEFRYCSLVIRILTGRRHQIRAHARAIGHPTACDSWYAPSAVRLTGADQSGPTVPRAWVRTPRWDGELPPPPPELEGQVY
mmetsp:Transcript_75556/g.171008  ORF Transcript_75556/g.171008 Transcript_75556/m.171008 type:complete len:230 (+) Transcript_75556:361-1050(+)